MGPLPELSKLIPDDDDAELPEEELSALKERILSAMTLSRENCIAKMRRI